jgi:hypothetical protein
MRTIAVKVPDVICYGCKLITKVFPAYGAIHGQWSCFYRRGNIKMAPYSAKPVKACREAEVSNG